MPGDFSDWMNSSGFLNASSSLAARTALGVLTAGSGSTTGSIFYVDSVTGTSGGAGTIASPTATIKQALVLCTASKGDVVVCFPGHVETIVNATDLAISKIGVSVVGMGSGAQRATITYGTATSANIPISAASVLLKNVVLLCNLDDTTAAVTISAADVTLEDVEVRDQTDKEFITPILTTAAADRLTIRRLFHNGFITGNACTEALSLIGVDVALIEDCRFLGNYGTAAINFLTTASTKVVIRFVTFAETGDKTMAKLVKDTVGGSTWVLEEAYDLVAGRSVFGSSGQAIQPDTGGWRFATATSTSPLTAATLFTYTGTIEAIFAGRVSTVIQSQATTVKLQVTSDALAAADLCGTKDVNAFLAGTLLSITGAVATGAVGATGVANAAGPLTTSLMTSVTSGTIQPVFGAASTGAIVWMVRWRPVSVGATLV